MTEKKTQIATEGGHYYEQDGTPAYEVPYADPKKGMRNTTLRDAKKLGLYPSVTTILNAIAKPGLVNWKINNILDSALTLPEIEGESVDDRRVRIIQDAEEQAKTAREKGTAIHGAIELALQEKPFNGDFSRIVSNVFDALNDLGVEDYEAERSFASASGYAGKLDLYGWMDKHQTLAIIDFKTTTFGKKKKLHYPEQAMQLAAYAEMVSAKNMLADYKCYNIFIDTDTAEVRVHEWDADEIETAWKKFMLVLGYWKLDKNFDPTGV